MTFCKYDAVAKDLFGGYRSYTIVEQSADHVVIEAEFPYEVWEYDRLHQPQRIVITPPDSALYDTALLMPVGIIGDGKKMHWKAVLFTEVGVQTPGSGEKVILLSNGLQMTVFGYALDDTHVWCEWDGRRRTGCFRRDELKFLQG